MIDVSVAPKASYHRLFQAIKAFGYFRVDGNAAKK
jgi:hypothetical protein